MEQVVRAIEQKSFIRELKQRRRRRQPERQKGNRFRLAKQKPLHVPHAFLYISLSCHCTTTT